MSVFEFLSREPEWC